MTNELARTVWIAAIGGIFGAAVCPAASLDGFPGIPARVSQELGKVLSGGSPDQSQDSAFFLPRRDFRTMRTDSGFALAQLKPEAVAIPECITLILWIQKRSGAEGSGVWFGFGQGAGHFLVVLTDSAGRPMVGILDRGGAHQFCRADVGGVNLADGRRHSLAVMLNLGSGLVRLFVDGRPEAGSILNWWRPSLMGTIFASGPADSPPLVIGRELSEEELRQLQDGNLPESLRSEPRLIEFAVSQRNLRPTR